MLSPLRLWRALSKLLRGKNILTIEQSEEVWDKQFTKGNWDFMVEEHKRIPARHIATHIAELPKPLSILDVGCGNGALALELSNQQGVLYAGIDISITALSKAQKLHPGGIFIHADAATPPQDNTYDIIVFSEVLYYVHLSTILRQYKDLLTQDGKVLISMYVSWRNTILWILLRRYITIETIKKVSTEDGSQSWHIATGSFATREKDHDKPDALS